MLEKALRIDMVSAVEGRRRVISLCHLNLCFAYAYEVLNSLPHVKDKLVSGTRQVKEELNVHSRSFKM